MLEITKETGYVLYTVNLPIFNDTIRQETEKSVASLYSSEGRTEFIIDLQKVQKVGPEGISLFAKIQRIVKKESGIFVLVTNNDPVLDYFAEELLPEIIILPTVEEAIELVYLHGEEAEYEDEDDEFGEENDY